MPRPYKPLCFAPTLHLPQPASAGPRCQATGPSCGAGLRPAPTRAAPTIRLAVAGLYLPSPAGGSTTPGSGLVVRPRVVERVYPVGARHASPLQAAMPCPYSAPAPAGFSRTTLPSAGSILWGRVSDPPLQEPPLQSAWVSLDCVCLRRQILRRCPVWARGARVRGHRPERCSRAAGVIAAACRTTRPRPTPVKREQAPAGRSPRREWGEEEGERHRSTFVPAPPSGYDWARASHLLLAKQELAEKMT